MLKLVYGFQPLALAADPSEFVFVEDTAARLAIKALGSTTWGEFAATVGRSLHEIIDEWGEEIKEAFGGKPCAEDVFSLEEYWGAWFFSDHFVTDPRQAAYDAVEAQGSLRTLFSGIGFSSNGGFPGFPGVEAISFHDEVLIARLRQELTERKQGHVLTVARDLKMVRQCLPGARGQEYGVVSPINP